MAHRQKKRVQYEQHDGRAVMPLQRPKTASLNAFATVYQGISFNYSASDAFFDKVRLG
jgi:hypothetical protein